MLHEDCMNAVQRDFLTIYEKETMKSPQKQKTKKKKNKTNQKTTTTTPTASYLNILNQGTQSEALQ